MFVDNNLILSGAIAAIVGAPGGPGQVTSTIAGQAVTGASAVPSTSCLDLTQARDIGEGADLYARFQITTTFAGLTALDMQICSSDDAAQSVNVTVHNSLQAVPVASLTAGARFVLQLSPYISPQLAGGNSRSQRYWWFRYNPTGTGTAGAVFADIGIEVQDGMDFYPSGFGII
jgi:hypothetical protein